MTNMCIKSAGHNTSFHRFYSRLHVPAVIASHHLSFYNVDAEKLYTALCSM